MDTNTTQCNKQGGAITDRDRFNQMHELAVLEQVEKFPYAGVSKKHLELISCVQLENIDVDNVDAHRGGTSAATFFEPSGPIDDGLKDVLSQHWRDLGPGQAARLYPAYRAGWFMNAWCKADPLHRDELVIDRFGGSAWVFKEDDLDDLEGTTGLVLPYGVLNNAHTHQYFSDAAFFPKDELKPHLACIINETLVSHDWPLRSEVHGAVTMIEYQLGTWDVANGGDHRIKPVMLYTFQSDQHARITMAYFDRDMGKIVLRQSRHFDIGGPEPTDDAWLLLRWMLNTPAGDTLVKEEDTNMPILVKEPAVSPAKSTHITVSSPSSNTGRVWSLMDRDGHNIMFFLGAQRADEK